MNHATWIRINLTLLLAITPLAAAAEPARGDGTLNLYYDARKESLDVRFRDAQGRPIPAAIPKIEKLLRSPDGQTRAIDIQLLDLVDAIQDHFQEPVIEIISGYRSPDYNKGLKDSGHAVANESLHMQGKAIDIHLDTVTEEAIRDYVILLREGGVGWYPQNDFVHVDLGEARTWGHAETKRKFVGLNNNTGPLTIRSNANRYFKNAEIFLTITPAATTPHWALEKFDRGVWKNTFSGDNKSLLDGYLRVSHAITKQRVGGRYRLRIAESLSNEFYVKN